MSDLASELRKVIEFDVKPAHREICDLAASGGRERWRMSIPVRPDDSDMVLQAPLDHIARLRPVLLAMIDVMAEVDEARKTIEMHTITNGVASSSFSANRMLDALDRLREIVGMK